jgi:CheY-like chemotaxis protein
MTEEPTPISNAVVLAARAGAPRRLQRLLDVLAELGVAVEVVETAEDAAARLLLADQTSPPCVLIDASSDGKTAVTAETVSRLEALRGTLPHVAPVVVAPDPSAQLVIECFRAGAGDFIDLAFESSAGVGRSLARVAADFSAKLERRTHIRELRDVVEEFLRDLVKTERRSIDLEHQLAREKSFVTEPSSDLDADRQPVIILVEDDRDVADMLADELEGAEISTFAFVSGEEAVINVEKMVSRQEAIDLAIIDARLPGIDGIETIRRIRKMRPALPAIIMTGYPDTANAVNAADLGVVGYVLKPFDDVGNLIQRIREQAVDSMNAARERAYLERIKGRHERVLLRYRKLAAELDRGAPPSE